MICICRLVSDQESGTPPVFPGHATGSRTSRRRPDGGRQAGDPRDAMVVGGAAARCSPLGDSKRPAGCSVTIGRSRSTYGGSWRHDGSCASVSSPDAVPDRNRRHHWQDDGWRPPTSLAHHPSSTSLLNSESSPAARAADQRLACLSRHSRTSSALHRVHPAARAPQPYIHRSDPPNEPT